jgi:hypothetical protein
MAMNGRGFAHEIGSSLATDLSNLKKKGSEAACEIEALAAEEVECLREKLECRAGGGHGDPTPSIGSPDTGMGQQG